MRCRSVGARRIGATALAASRASVTGHVIGTYLHGPALARNPALADLLLSWIVGALGPLDDTIVDSAAGRASGA